MPCSNVVASLLRRFVGPKRSILVRYEDLLLDPEVTIRRLGRFLDLSTEELVRRVEDNQGFQVGHIVGGNRLRLDRIVKLRTEFRRKNGHGLNLKLSQRLIFLLLGGWLQRVYRYTS